MSLARKVKRNQVNKLKKDLKQEFKKVTKMIDSTEKSCLTCREVFDNKNSDHLDKWTMEVYDDHAELYCDKCYPLHKEKNDDQSTKTETF